MISHEWRRNALTAATAAVIVLKRLGIGGHWKSWDAAYNFACAWFIHYIALIFLIGIANVLASHFHEFFFGDVYNYEFANSSEFQYRLTMLVFVLFTLMIIGSNLPPGTFSDLDQ